jgi:hypothetical protein
VFPEKVKFVRAQAPQKRMVNPDFESLVQPGKGLKSHENKSNDEFAHKLWQLACHRPDLPWHRRCAGPR